MILTSAERSDSGTYTLNIFDEDGRSKGSYTLQVTIEDLILPILSSVCGILIVLAVLAFCIYKKRQGLTNKEAPGQYEGVEYGTVVTSNQKKKEDEVQCGELVFNTPAQKKSKVSKVQEECVYSGVQHSHAERSDSGTYTLNIFDVGGRSKGNYTLQVTIEARVSSVKLSYRCLSSEVRKVYCSADGDNLHFNWTPDSIIRMENDNKTLVLDKKHNEKVTCHVKNHVSRDHNSTDLLECAGFLFIISVNT
ncbi:hypothetical protein QTP86_015411 [Hemibagrus guttatus]|nr:hypothetical protein QTP86_015411 [Hemibagrus guttatus]